MPVLVILGVPVTGLMVGLAAFLALCAFFIFAMVIDKVLSHVGFGGINLGGVFSRFLKSAMSALAAQFDTVVHPLAHMFYSMTVGTWHILYQIVATIADAKQWAVSAYNHASAIGAGVGLNIGAAVAEAEALAQSEINNVEISAIDLTNGAIAYATSEAQLAHNEAVNLFTSAENYAYGIGGDVVSEATRLFADAETFAAQQVGQVQSEAVTLFGQAEALAQGLADSVQSEAVRLFGQAEAYTDQVAAGLGVAAIAGTLAQVLPRVATLEAEATTCLEPLCDTVTPNAGQLGNLGNLLKGLDGIFDAVLLGGLLAAAVEDPELAARGVVDVTGWVPTLGVELARAVGAAV